MPNLWEWRIAGWRWSSQLKVSFLIVSAFAALSAESQYVRDRLRFTPVFPESLQGPIAVVPVPAALAPVDSGYFLVAEKSGRLALRQEGRPGFQTILDLSSAVSTSSEEGLLNVVLPPLKNTPGKATTTVPAYIYWSRNKPKKQTVLSRLPLQFVYKDGLKITAGVPEDILTIFQPYANHNGGGMVFGSDGYLYLGIGDGGSGGDPRGYGQNPGTLLGKILRIDVSPERGYRIPPGNPFIGKAHFRPEIFAYGLRNPWRITWSQEKKLIVAADVGQNDYEEINLIRSGGNYGWNVTEGFHCYKPRKDCVRTGLSDPVLEYDHSEGRSILGGEFYDGSLWPEWKGRYIFADSVNGQIWLSSLEGKPASKTLLAETSFYLSSFARDHRGELLICDLDSGKIFRIVPP